MVHRRTRGRRPPLGRRLGVDHVGVQGTAARRSQASSAVDLDETHRHADRRHPVVAERDVTPLRSQASMSSSPASPPASPLRIGSAPHHAAPAGSLAAATGMVASCRSCRTRAGSGGWDTIGDRRRTERADGRLLGQNGTASGPASSAALGPGEMLSATRAGGRCRRAASPSRMRAGFAPPTSCPRARGPRTIRERANNAQRGLDRRLLVHHDDGAGTEHRPGGADRRLPAAGRGALEEPGGGPPPGMNIFRSLPSRMPWQ